MIKFDQLYTLFYNYAIVRLDFTLSSLANFTLKDSFNIFNYYESYLTINPIKSMYTNKIS